MEGERERRLRVSNHLRELIFKFFGAEMVQIGDKQPRCMALDTKQREKEKLSVKIFLMVGKYMVFLVTKHVLRIHECM